MDTVLGNMIENAKIAWLMLSMKCGRDQHRWRNEACRYLEEHSTDSVEKGRVLDYKAVHAWIATERRVSLTRGDECGYEDLSTLARRVTREEYVINWMKVLRDRRGQQRAQKTASEQ